MRVIVANTVGKLDSGELVVAFPSRWDSVVAHKVGGRFDFYPYELGYTSAMLKKFRPDFNVTMIDGCHECLNADEYLERLKLFHPNVLITECSALTYQAMTRVRKGLRCSAYLAGPYGMANREQAERDGWKVLNGEFEYHIADAFGITHPDTPFVDLDWLPYPEDHDVSRIEYEEPFGNPYNGMVQIYATRGCPLACNFCVVPTYYGGHGQSHKSHRCRNVDNVCDEIESLANKYGDRFNGAYFHDEAHNANPKWLAEFCQALIRRGLNRYHYDAMCGYWTFTEELIALMAQAGYCNIRIGIESLSEDVTRAIGKVVFEDKLIRVLEWCKKYGMRTYGTTQVGAVNSSEERDLKSLEGLLELRKRGLLDIWQNSVSTPMPGTPFYDEAKKNGWLITDDMTQYNGVRSVVSYPHYSAERINFVKREYERLS